MFCLKKHMKYLDIFWNKKMYNHYLTIVISVSSLLEPTEERRAC